MDSTQRLMYARSAASQLEPWAAGDFDNHADTVRAIYAEGERLSRILDEEEGDARAIVVELQEELTALAGMADGALRLAREAIDLAVASGAAPDRAAVLARLVDAWR